MAGISRWWTALLLVTACTNDYDGLVPAPEAPGAGGAAAVGGAANASTGGTTTGAAGGGGAPPCRGDAAELCDNQLDDDGDGLADCLDEGCIGCAPCAGAVYVAPGATGDGSYLAPFGSVDEALGACGTVYLFPGTYPPILLPADCTLIGSGPDATIVDAAPEATVGILVADGGREATVAYLEVRGATGADGGGIALEAGALELIGVTVRGCLANRGGGVFSAEGTDLDAASLTLLDNTATNEGGGAFLGGTGEWRALRVEGNLAQKGGGLYLGAEDVQLVDAQVGPGNVATLGGGIYQTAGGTNKIERTRVTGNSATANGGGLLVENGELLMVNALFTGNTAADGGAVFVLGPNVAFKHITVSKNVGANASGIQCSGGPVPIRSSILWDNDPAPTLDGECALRYSAYAQSTGADNISDDPQFVLPDAGNFHLKPGSPCRETGDPSSSVEVDLDGAPRDATPDMGAYEVQ